MVGRKPWALADYGKRRKEYIKGKSCKWCGSKENLVLHHPQKPNSLSDKDYRSLVGVEVLCSSCHYAIHRYMRKHGGRGWSEKEKEVRS